MPESSEAYTVCSNRPVSADPLHSAQPSPQEFKRETRFTSKCPADEIINKIAEAAKPLGFDVQKKNYKMRLENVKAGRKGNLNVATEIFQVAPSLHMVEVRKAKGDTLEFHKFYKNLSTSLDKVVWKSEEDMKK
uniref:non-specific serine/threonine protein kinase n=1 Tax=Kalanchoe fedtschenkoi TaxID=63787 RepID=A0A7N0VJ50_KALFE